MKNDTIGFFGPVGWAWFSDAADPIRCLPGRSLLAERCVEFEQWGIDAVARRLSALPAVQPAIAPRRLGFVALAENRAVSALAGSLPLTDAELAVLRECEGDLAGDALAAELVSRRPDLFRDRDAVYRVLEALQSRQLIDWTLVRATRWQPDRGLRAGARRSPPR